MRIKTLELPKRGRMRYPFAQMAVGDRFQIKCPPRSREKLAKRVGGAAVMRRARHGEQFTTRQTDKGIVCERIW